MLLHGCIVDELGLANGSRCGSDGVEDRQIDCLSLVLGQIVLALMILLGYSK